MERQNNVDAIQIMLLGRMMGLSINAHAMFFFETKLAYYYSLILLLIHTCGGILNGK